MKKLSVVILVSLTCNLANAQVKIPPAIIGNWISKKSNNWDLGLFEHFAVYQSGFWNYGSVQSKQSTTTIELLQGNKTVSLRVVPTNFSDSCISIAVQTATPELFRKHHAGFVPYSSADIKPFKNSGFRQDTVTIIGYYRNLKEYNKRADKDQDRGPFSVTIPNEFIQNKELSYFADLDSSGRFKIKFPVLNTQEVFLDWGRLNQTVVVEPGETLFLYADLADYVEDGNEAYVTKDKQILFMGKEARLHNEVAGYHRPMTSFNLEEAAKKFPSDIELQDSALALYKRRLMPLEKHIAYHPTLSNRFKEYQYASEKYTIASVLMQHRFHKGKNNNPISFDEGYMNFFQKNMDFTNEKLFTLVGQYSGFIQDYVGYYNEMALIAEAKASGKTKSSLMSANSAEAVKYLTSKVKLTREEDAVVDTMLLLQEILVPKIIQLKDTAERAKIIAPYQQLFTKFQAIQEKPDIKNNLKQTISTILNDKKLAFYRKTIDSLFQNATLKELLIARQLYYMVDHDQIPLSDYGLSLANERLAKRSLKNYVLDADKYYRSLDGKHISYQASLKKTDHLKESKDADLLFKELISPYKGKVIYVDFWGTWCVPCIQQMPYAVKLKKELAGKDVIFMYFANNSPENSWTNAIKKMDLSGDNVVHYRLPDQQQAMIERKFLIEAFPTYMLVGRDGQLVTDKAPRPEQSQELKNAIKTLLSR